MSGDPGPHNRRVWAAGRYLHAYASRQLRPVEVVLLVRYREDLSGEVLELGSGAGRISGYVCEIARRYHGIDISRAMVAEARRRYPVGEFIEGDLRDLSRFADGGLDAVIAGWNVLDVFSDSERRAALGEIRRVLRSGGLLVMSSHNRNYLANVRGPLRVRTSDPLRLAADVVRAPQRYGRHRRLRHLERSTADYQIVSDGSHRHTLVHYFITPEAQFAQLEQEGFEPLECLDLDGHPRAAGDPLSDVSELHYVARRR